MEILGFVACSLIGISLGLIGAGGSILMVPVLVFLFHIPPLQATSYALFVVGMTSAAAALPKYWRGEVLVGPALWFGSVSMGVTMMVRHFIVPQLPSHIFHISYGRLTMLIFALLMLISAIHMIQPNEVVVRRQGRQRDRIRMLISAIGIGLITGFLGVGGGFLIVPVFAAVLGSGIRQAIGTSLVVIALNALSGFLTDMATASLDRLFLSTITLVALLGSISGTMLAAKVDALRLKYFFGCFVLIMALSIVAVECYQQWLEITQVMTNI